MSSDSEDEQKAISTLLPEKSKKTYDLAYNTFMKWRATKNTNSFSEDNLLAYFDELAKKYKSSSLWTFYSMLRCTLHVRHNVNIENYTKLRSFLKRLSDGYEAKKAAVFTPDQIRKFINEAPDDNLLATKIALIMGVMGSCRATELYLMKVEHLHDHNTAFVVDVPDSKTKAVRQFSITGSLYDIVKKYRKLRPANLATNAFFINVRKNKCTMDTIGINKFRSLGKQVATYLKLPNPEKYTGHCLRRSSATILTDGGANTISLKHHCGSKSIENCIERSTIESCSSNDTGISNVPDDINLNLVNSNISSTVSSNHINVDMNSTPPCINFTNCNNVTVYFNSK